MKAARIARWAGGGRDSPFTLEINPTNRCNLKCRSCWQREFPVNADELPAEKWIQTVREAGRLGVKDIRIPGSGEPLMKQGIIDLMEAIKAEGINGLLITNGTLLDASACKAIIEMGWDCLTVSIDGASPEVNDYLRGREGTYELIRRNLIGFSRQNKKTFLRLNTVISNRNYSKLGELLGFASEVGAKDCQFQPMTVWGKDGRLLEMDAAARERFQGILPSLIRKAEEMGISTNLPTLLDNDLMEKASGRMDELILEESSGEDSPYLKLPCYEPWYNMVILPNGDVAPCSMAGSRDADSIRGKSLEDVWFGERFALIRKRLLARDLPEYCKRCCAVVHVENDRIRERLRGML